MFAIAPSRTAILLSVLVATIAVLSARPCHAQCTVDNSPNADGIIESRVSCPNDASGNAAFALDGQGRFIVVWQRPRPSPPPNTSPIDLLFRRIDSDGAALHEPLALNDTGEIVPNPDQLVDQSIHTRRWSCDVRIGRRVYRPAMKRLATQEWPQFLSRSCGPASCSRRN